MSLSTLRGHNIHRQKSRRSLFSQKKNRERKQQSLKLAVPLGVSVLGTSPPSQDVSMQGLACFTGMKLPDHWRSNEEPEYTDFYKLESCSDAVCQISFNLKVRKNLSWAVTFRGKDVPSGCELFDNFPLHLALPETVYALLTFLNTLVLCPGNPEKEYVSLCIKRGGVMRTKRGRGNIIASIDDTRFVIDQSGHHHSQTIRHSLCAVLCKSAGSEYPQRCIACNQYRKSLRSSLCKSGSGSDVTAASSRVPFTVLTN